MVDGYHGFMALPTDLSEVKDRIFYLSGGYKYAQGGEGGCFAHIPKTSNARPVYTGWYAEFGELDQVKTGQVNYSTNGMRFAGSTMDYSPLYRLLASLSMLEDEGLSVDKIHAYVQSLQHVFLEKLDACKHPLVNRETLMCNDLSYHGHFLTFKLPSPDDVVSLAGYLREHGIMTDHRGDRLRFGFALYQIADNFDLSCLNHVERSN